MELKQGKIAQRRARILEQRDKNDYSLKPRFPYKVQVELSNICNHTCIFCPIEKMTRDKRQLDTALLERVLKEAYDLGAREVGLFSGAEPFASPHLYHFIAYAKQTGYEYVFISTNGSIPTKEKMARAIDAGLDSIKFSINAGTRESYKLVHGMDHFDRVIEMVKFVDEYRKDHAPHLISAVSFVECQENEGTLALLKDLIDPYIDEMIRYNSINTSGQMFGYPGDEHKPPCPLPFETFHISVEGYVRACCNDYQNNLAMEDLATMSVAEAFYSERFQDLRQRHLDDRLEGTLCYTCLKNRRAPVNPLNEKLGVAVDASWYEAAKHPRFGQMEQEPKRSE